MNNLSNQPEQQTYGTAVLPPINQNLNQSLNVTPIEKEAQLRKMDRSLNQTHDGTFVKSDRFNRPKGFAELNRLSNKLFIDNHPSDMQPNNPYWFGKAGTANSNPNHTPSNNQIYNYDARRRNLLKSLENSVPVHQKSSYF